MTKERIEVQTPCLCGDSKCGSVDLTWCEVGGVTVGASGAVYEVTIEPDEVWAVTVWQAGRDVVDAAERAFKRVTGQRGKVA